MAKKVITNPTNIEMVNKMCAEHPTSSYAQALGFNAEKGSFAHYDLNLFLANPDIANEFISDMSNMIVSQRTYDLLRGYEMPFGVFRKEFSKLGDAEQLLTASLQDLQDWDTVSTDVNPFDARKPSISISFIKTTDKKMNDVCLEYDSWSGAFISESGLSNLAGIILKGLNDSIALYIYDCVRKDLSTASGDVTKTATITAITGAGETQNAQKAYEEIIALVTKMSLPSVNYNKAGLKTLTPKGRAVLLLNANYKASFDVNVLASLFNSAEIGSSKYFKEVIVCDLEDGCVGVVLDEEAYMWGYRFETTGSIYNPKSRAISTYKHAWLKRGVVPFRQAVRLITA